MTSAVWAVIRREYLQRVRSKWFVIGTVGGPLIMAGMILVPIYFAERGQDAERTIAVVDGTNVLYDRIAPDLESAGWTVSEERWHADVVTELRERADEGEIGGFLMVDELTLESGEATLYVSSRPSPIRQLSMRTVIGRAALEYQLEQTGVDVAAMLEGGELRRERLSEDGSGASEPEFLVAYIGSLFLYMTLLLYAVAVLRATLEEKTNRIVEVIISSMKPWHLMLGKIVGVGAVGLTQMAVWAGALALFVVSGIPMLAAANPEAGLSALGEILPSAGLIGIFVGFFLFGYFMYSGLYAAVGAMCNTDEEAQQAQLPLIMLLVIPLLMVTSVIQDPNSAMATVLSLIPPFTPMLMWSRIVSGGAPAWQVGLSFVLMFLAILAIAWVAGRIYKVGILMAGKRPTLPEVWRWVREG